MTRLLSGLEESGLVTRAAVPTDRRSSLITITAAGRELLAFARTRKDAFLSARIERLGVPRSSAPDLLERVLEEPGA